jgi:glycosyltransferase involved in cell wall biosynthesis
VSATGRVAVFLPALAGGGAERVLLLLAGGFAARGVPVDVVVPHTAGAYRDEVPTTVRLVELGARGAMTSLPRLVTYLRRERPSALLSTLTHANIVALWARAVARVPTRIVVREANTISVATRGAVRLRDRLMPFLVRRVYPLADAIVAVSDGVARDLERTAGVPPGRIRRLDNPIVTDDLRRLAAQPLEDPWFAPGDPPVVLGVGRLERQKDFATLIRAFARVRAARPARLVLLGEGSERRALEALVVELGLEGEVRLPGFVANPFAYMARAGVFVLSSAWEGMPGALIQALACGVPVVATDCESGPREILGAGRSGRLVPVGDAAAMALAITGALEGPRCPPDERALAPFTQAAAVDGYLHLLSGTARG